MDTRTWLRAKEIYLQAASLPPGERRPLLDRECGADDALRREVDALLEAEATKSFLVEPFVPQAPPQGLTPGTMLGRFRIEAPAGKGGFGVVYRATDIELHRPVAIKVMPEESAGAPGRRARFAREAVAASALNHPNIVTVYQAGTESGRDYIAMEYIDGSTLASAIGSKPLPIQTLLRYAIEIADAVAAAHEAGIVHRDLKPANVMVTSRGRIKVLDFGLAKPAPGGRAEEARPGMSTLTAEGVVVGTIAYMSPEQAEGKPVDARSDIFSFGSILYEMATGRQAFRAGTQMGVLAEILRAEPPPARELALGLPADFESTLRRCLRKDPAERWQSLADVKLLLEDALNALDSPAPVGEPPAKRGAAWQWLLAAAAGGALVAGLALSRRAPAGSGEPEGVLRMLTADSGLSTFPALSRDGRLVAFASDRSREGNLDIWLQQIGGQEPMRLTNDPADDRDPAFSPDGTRVAFRSERSGGGVYVAPALGGGGTPVLLAPGGRNPRFSPDGRWIAYWTGREGSYAAGSSKVFVIEAGGGQPRQVHPEMAVAMFPVWSPGGDRLVVLGRRAVSGALEQTLDWFVLPVGPGGNGAGQPRKTGALPQFKKQGLTERRLAWQTRPVVFDWTPTGDGDRLLFAAPLGDTGNLWEARLSAGGEIRGPARRVSLGPGLQLHASRSLSGGTERVAFSNEELNFDIWSLPVDPARGTPKGEMKRVTEEKSIEWSPSITRDGGVLAYLSKGTEGWLLRRRDLAAGRDATLLSSPLRMVNARIAGDGSRIAYSNSEAKVFSVGVGGGPVEGLCDRCGTVMGISEDGGRITYEPEQEEDLLALNRTDRQSRKLAPRPKPDAILSGGSFSPDGRWAAFHSIHNETSTAQIWVVPAAGGRAAEPSEWIAITDGKSQEREPAWAPNGGLLYFLSERDGFRCIWARRFDPGPGRPSGESFAVQHLHTARRSMQWVGISGYLTGLSAGGDLLVFALGELTGNIWLEETARGQ